MHELATFSIETDTVVLLRFKNGRSRRVPAVDVASYVYRADAEKIKAAYRLRSQFIDTHMPKMRIILVLALGAGILGLTVVTGGKALAGLFHGAQSSPQATPQPDGIARSIVEPSPTPELGKKLALAAKPTASSPFKVPIGSKKAAVAANVLQPANKPVPSLVMLLTPLPTPIITALAPVTDAAGNVLDAATGPADGVLGGVVSSPSPTPSASPSPSPVPPTGSLPGN